MSITGAGGLLWFRDDRGDIAVITGKESKFLSDIVHDIENVPLEELQQVRESNLLAAKNAFKKNASQIEKSLGMEIKFDTPVKVAEDLYKCNYRFLPQSFKRGISKGKIESGEEPKDTVRREIIEELGMDFGQSHMIDLGRCANYQMYSLDIKVYMSRRTINEIIEEVQSRISSRKHIKYGELFDVSIKSLDQVIESVRNNEFNYASALAITKFVQIHGSERQKSRIESRVTPTAQGIKRSKKRSKKRGIKRSKKRGIKRT
jgi:8-oxo-dGTP pyrophosphatase MutT (NUDIX family)